MPLRSQTWRDLRRLLKELPPSRLRFLVVVLVTLDLLKHLAKVYLLNQDLKDLISQESTG